MSRPAEQGSGVRDRTMVAQLWPVLAAAALGLVPFTVMSTFLVPISRDAGEPVDLIGGFRGLGGVAALVLGAGAAPIIDRLPRHRTAALALLLLASGCAAASVGTLVTWVVFCVVIGAGTSLLNPALAAMAADRYDDEAASGRAATMVSSATTLTAVLSAPLLAAPAMLWGWRGDLVAAGLLCVVVAGLLWRGGEGSVRPASSQRPGYGQALRQARRVPGALMLIAVSTLRTACFMGQLAYVAAYFDDRFHLGAGRFSFVWTLSGAAFFCGNWQAGRLLAAVNGRRRAGLIAGGGAVVASGGAALLFTSAWLPAALVAVVMVAAGHALVAAAVTTLLVRRAGAVRGTVLSLNGSGQSLGVFVGAGAVGAALGLGGWAAVGLVLALGMLVCAVLVRSEASRPAAEPSEGDGDLAA